ncbi:MAG TPA: class I SAM-dependent methyltransferase [Pyrinomonadaceae bacterium]|nr:class I SAM-dependent methyltransferase [Pyrinomonadaceae bacterium]
MPITNPKHDDRQADETLREWRENAFYWQKHRDPIRTMFAPVTQALIDAAGIIQGQSVLDVAGGSGEPSLTIAEKVGPTGSVLCSDVVAEMVGGAQSEAQRLGLTNIQFRQCAADSLPFENDSFDVVVCRLGAMFFPDPLAGLSEMLRVTKPSGVIALAVWGRSELNPFFSLSNAALERHLAASTPADRDAPGAFRFAEPGNLARILQQAGAIEVRENPLEFQIVAPFTPKEFWEMRAETSGTLRQKLATLSQQQRDQVAQEVEEAATRFFSDNQMSLPANVIIVTGRKE